MAAPTKQERTREEYSPDSARQNSGASPLSRPTQQMSEPLTTYIVMTTVVPGEGWRGWGSHLSGRRHRNGLLTNTFRTAVCFLWNVRCEKEGI